MRDIIICRIVQKVFDVKCTFLPHEPLRPYSGHVTIGEHLGRMGEHSMKVGYYG